MARRTPAGARLTEVWLSTISLIYYSIEWRMKSLLTSSLLFISIQFNDIVNNHILGRRAHVVQAYSSAHSEFCRINEMRMRQTLDIIIPDWSIRV